jgi:hypothetical protein
MAFVPLCPCPLSPGRTSGHVITKGNESLDQQKIPDEPAAGLDPRDRPASDTAYPRTDLILLPCIFLLTWLLISLAGEAVARITFPEQQLDPCHITESTGGRFQPNCQSRIKILESGWTDNHYNDCGFRSTHSCRTRIPNSLRVAVLGTSISRGDFVSYNESFAGRVEQDLTQGCRRPVDLQNVSQADAILTTDTGWIPIWHHIADRVPEALQLQPDAFVLVMAPFDLASYDTMPAQTAPEQTTPEQATPPAPACPSSLHRKLTHMLKTAKDSLANDSRLMLLARHLAYRDTDRYVLHELGQGDSADYLRQPFTANWSLRLKVADATIGRIATQAKAAGLPLIVVLMPLRAQAALSAEGANRHQTDPFALGKALSSIVQAHGAAFIDLTNVISTFRDPAGLFYEINGHPNAAGHAALAASVEQALVNDVPAFASCGPAGR